MPGSQKGHVILQFLDLPGQGRLADETGLGRFVELLIFGHGQQPFEITLVDCRVFLD